jgi:hypothetical protein
MRFGMALIKNEHGVLHVRRKVPKGLEVATSRVMGAPKERVSWLKETLRNKGREAGEGPRQTRDDEVRPYSPCADCPFARRSTKPKCRRVVSAR